MIILPEYTQHYKLTKPLKTEKYLIDDVCNDNADKVDKELYSRANKVKNATANNIPLLTSDGDIIDSGKNISSISNAFMISTMPAPSEENQGLCYMYIGSDTTQYESGTFYKCVYDATNKIYKWEKLSIVGINYKPLRRVTAIPGI